jgi:hypothetical protein
MMPTIFYSSVLEFNGMHIYALEKDRDVPERERELNAKG